MVGNLRLVPSGGLWWIFLAAATKSVPTARIDRMGLIWMLNGNRLVAMTADSAVIETKGGSRLTLRKRERLASHASASA